MNVAELIKDAATVTGSQRALAEQLGVHYNVLTYWKNGRERPSATRIAEMAEIAGLPVLETVAEIEAQIDEKNSAVWSRALSAMRRGAVAAVMTAAVVGLHSPRAEAAVNETSSCTHSAHMFARLRRIARALKSWIASTCSDRCQSPRTI